MKAFHEVRKYTYQKKEDGKVPCFPLFSRKPAQKEHVQYTLSCQTEAIKTRTEIIHIHDSFLMTVQPDTHSNHVFVRSAR